MSHDSDPVDHRDEIFPAVWRELDRAVERARNACDGLLGRDELRTLMDWLRDTLREGGARALPPLTHGVAPDTLARVIACVRQEFIHGARALPAAEAHQSIHVLSALGRVQANTGRRRASLAAPAPDRPPRLDEALQPAVDVAHDMRSPLAAMLFLIETMRSGRSGPVNPLQEQQLAMVYSAALGLNQLACDLIDYVRGEEWLIDEQSGPLSVAEVLHAVQDIIRPIAEEKGVRLQLGLPEDDARLGQAGALQRVLLNLVTNAVKFASGGTVVVAARQLAGTRVEFSVHDFGEGIPDAVVAELFEPFRSSAGASHTTFSSSGLGLAICHRLVAMLGGELRVSTGADRGTRFYFDVDLPHAQPAQ